MPVVLHIVYSGLGGIASVFFSLAEAANNDGYEHAVAFYGIEPLVPDYSERCERLGITHRYFQRRPRFDPSVNGRLYQWMEELQPTVVIVHLPRALKPALRFRSKYPNTCVIGVEHHPNVLKRAIDWFDSVRFARGCNHVVYLTSVYRHEVAQRLGRLFAPEKSVVIPNGISTTTFQPSVSRHSSQHQNTGNVVKLGMCSRLSAQKDILTLLQALSLARGSNDGQRLSLSLAGDGPQRTLLEQEAARLGLGNVVRFEGFLAEAELVTWFQELDIYVHATLSETMSTSVMQALASGLPCIASDISGMDELVPAQVGLRVPPGDVPALSAALLALAEDSEHRKRLGFAARDYACERLSRERAWADYRALIEVGNEAR